MTPFPIALDGGIRLPSGPGNAGDLVAGSFSLSRGGLSVGRRTLDVIDDQEFNGAFPGFELEAQLLLERGEDG